jgi:hypothetical protein
MSSDSIGRFVDIQRYPHVDTNVFDGSRLIDACRRDLDRTGICVLPGFVRHKVLGEILRDSRPLLSQAFHQTVTGNAYLSEGDVNLPAEHPLNRTATTRLGVIAYDQFPVTHALRRLYHHPDFMGFVEACIGRGKLYEYECPLGKINIAVMSHGDHLRWHFDQSDFVVSMPLQEPDGGGVFEYVHNLRSAQEPHYDSVAAVLEGDRSRVRALDTPPGSLVLFEGRYTLHRVTEVLGERPRLMALFGYALERGVTSSPYLRKIRYGRDA